MTRSIFQQTPRRVHSIGTGRLLRAKAVGRRLFAKGVDLEDVSGELVVLTSGCAVQEVTLGINDNATKRRKPIRAVEAKNVHTAVRC